MGTKLYCGACAKYRTIDMQQCVQLMFLVYKQMYIEIFYWQLGNLQSTSLGVLSKCVASGRACKGNLHRGSSLWNIFQCCVHRSGIKLILKLLRHVSVFLHHPLGAYKFCQIKLWIIESINLQVPWVWCKNTETCRSVLVIINCAFFGTIRGGIKK